MCCHPGVGIFIAMEGSIVAILSRDVCVCVCVCVCVWQLPFWNSEVEGVLYLPFRVPKEWSLAPSLPWYWHTSLRPSKAQKTVLSLCLYAWATFFTKTSALQTGTEQISKK